MRLVAITVLAGAFLAGPGLAAPRAAPIASLSSPTVSAVWKESWLTASVHYAGTVNAPARVTITVRPTSRTGPPLARTTIDASGAFAGDLKLPARSLPGQYGVRLTGQGLDGATMAPVEQPMTIPAPPEGIVDRSSTGRSRAGPAMRAAPAPQHALYARFHFLYPPANGKVTFEWRTPSYKYVGKITKPYAPDIFTFVHSRRPLEVGKWWCIVRSGGRVATRVEMRIF